MSQKEPTSQQATPVDQESQAKTIVVRKSILPMVVGTLAILAVAAVPSYYFYAQYQHSQQLLQNPTAAAQEETKSLISKVGKLIQLPSKETPTVATVSDKNKLKDQAFFQNAENGDKVLLYTNGKKAILYRPSANKIIEVAPINLGNVAGASTQQTYTVAIYNGTTVSGLATTFEKQLKEKVNNLEVITKENAASFEYTKTMVIDVKGDKKDAVAQIAKAIGAVVGTMPAGEKKPQADFLIILGE